MVNRTRTTESPKSLDIKKGANVVFLESFILTLTRTKILPFTGRSSYSASLERAIRPKLLFDLNQTRNALQAN